jgi:hypothetical protein
MANAPPPPGPFTLGAFAVLPFVRIAAVLPPETDPLLDNSALAV